MRKIRVLMPSEKLHFWENVNGLDIHEKLNLFVESLVPKINISALDGWLLTISIMSRSSDRIGIAKRMAKFPSDKEYEIYISIPIPDKNEIKYGIGEQVHPPFFKFVNEKHSYAIEPRFDAYENLDDYVLETAKSAINFAFTKGFTCKGVKIKFQSNP